MQYIKQSLFLFSILLSVVIGAIVGDFIIYNLNNNLIDKTQTIIVSTSILLIIIILAHSLENWYKQNKTNKIFVTIVTIFYIVTGLLIYGGYLMLK